MPIDHPPNEPLRFLGVSNILAAKAISCPPNLYALDLTKLLTLNLAFTVCRTLLAVNSAGAMLISAVLRWLIRTDVKKPCREELDPSPLMVVGFEAGVRLQ
jgi:hypothetical protein